MMSHDGWLNTDRTWDACGCHLTAPIRIHFFEQLHCEVNVHRCVLESLQPLHYLALLFIKVQAAFNGHDLHQPYLPGPHLLPPYYLLVCELGEDEADIKEEQDTMV